MIGDGHGKRPWVYYDTGKGLFRRLHRYSGAVLLAIFLVTPWVRIAGAPIFRVELADRRLFVLGQMFTALDTRYLLLVLLLAALGLGMFTAVLGRVWCGYACPQTVFLEEIIRRVETWIEGSRGARRKLDAAPWSREKVVKKVSKYTIFLLVSVALTLTFQSYFFDAATLWTGQAAPGVYFVAAVLSGLLFFDLAWFREQFCNYLCPYARIQSVLTDANTWTVGYDPRRGEPRLGTPGVAKLDVFNLGSCVDCNRCVTACPQGIDIRNGFQLECITCGHCIDACTDVMGKRNFPSLIQYTTEARLSIDAPQTSRLRPILYASIIAVLALATAVSLLSRDSFDARVTRTRGVDPELQTDGRIRNMYDGHIWNNNAEPRAFAVSVQNLGEAVEVIVPFNPIRIAASDDLPFPVIVIAPADATVEHTTTIQFIFEEIESGEAVVRDVAFVTPRTRNR
jgi:cytochrome c oxidase accessory protein FixG